MEKVRVAIVGVGAIAINSHLPSYVKRNDVEIVGFVDLETERVHKIAKKFAEDHGCPVPGVFSTIESMIEHTSVDAVSICTPNSTHVEYATKALQNGLHVLLEKPMSTSAEEAKALEQLALSRGKTAMVGMSHRYREDVTVLKRFIEAGDLGNIYYAKTRILRRRGTPRGWFTDLQISGGGPLMDIGVHALDLTWWLMGMPKIHSANGFMIKGVENEKVDFNQSWEAMSSTNKQNEVYTTEDFAAAFLRFGNNSAMQLEVSWALNGPEDDALKVELYGSRGGLTLDPLRIYSTTHGVLMNTTPAATLGPFYEHEINHFMDCVKNRSTVISDFSQGYEVVRMLNMIAESASTGREIHVT